MSRRMGRSGLVSSLLLVGAACAPGGSAPSPQVAAPTAPVASVPGFSGPESVRYDADQDVYFVGNWNGPPANVDNNGFISRMRPDGTVDQLRFIAGGSNGATLHAPRGMTIVGDTLWMADTDAVRGFNRRTGAPVASIDFTSFRPGFLNDITPGPDGALYVTDTGQNRIYRIAGRTATIALQDTVLNRPNGITWDRRSDHLVVLPYGGKQALLSWRPGERTLQPIATGPSGKYDGGEILANRSIVVSAQTDSTLILFANGRGTTWAKLGGAPADIAVDTRRRRVAVPYVGRNLVEIWQLP